MPNIHSKPHQVRAEPVMNDQVKLHSSRFDFSLVSLPDALIFSHGEPSVRFIHSSGWEASLFTHLPQYEDNIISFILLPVGFVDGIERFIPLISGNQMLNEPPSSMKCSTVWGALVLSLAQESIITKFFYSYLSSCSWTLKASFFFYRTVKLSLCVCYPSSPAQVRCGSCVLSCTHEHRSTSCSHIWRVLLPFPSFFCLSFFKKWDLPVSFFRMTWS